MLIYWLFSKDDLDHSFGTHHESNETCQGKLKKQLKKTHEESNKQPDESLDESKQQPEKSQKELNKQPDKSQDESKKQPPTFESL